jgi:hypothetical protein
MLHAYLFTTYAQKLAYTACEMYTRVHACVRACVRMKCTTMTIIIESLYNNKREWAMHLFPCMQPLQSTECKGQYI